jgi:Flp pilus assembly protein TadG
MRVRGVRRWSMDQGSNLVEFSLIAFMFIIVLVGIVEMGRMVLVYTTVANAARAGARYAIVHGGDRTGSGYDGPSGPGSTTQVVTVVKNFASAGLLNTANLTITVAYPGAKNTAGYPVTVTVTYPYDPLVRYFNSLLATTMGSTSEGVITF